MAQGNKKGYEQKTNHRTTELEVANNNLAILNDLLVKRDQEREQAQAALRESEERFRALFDNNHAVMLVIDPTTGSIIDANAAAISYYGYSAKVLLNMTISEINILTPEQVKKEMNQAKTSKQNHFYFKHRLANGNIRDVEVFSGPVVIQDRQLLYSIIHDITERKDNETSLKRFADRLALAADAGNIGIWEWDVDTGHFHWDDKMMEMYKKSPHELTGTYEDWSSRIHPDDLAETEKRLAEAIEQNKPFEYGFRIIWPDGQIRHIKAAGLIRLEDDKIKSITGVNWDETATRQLEEELRRLATTDELTGANNRRHFMERAAAEISRSRRYASPVSMLTIDIDHFKDVNDTYGHPAGDEVLKTLVRVCKETLRISDVFARMGGEEFSAILPETDAKAAYQSAERLRKAVAKTKALVDDQIISYTVSIGVSQIQGPEDSFEELMRRADTALYRAKDLGRNRVESA